MRIVRVALVAALVLAAGTASAHPWPRPGSLVTVDVEVEGAAVPLYPARDGSGRYYVEARRGGRYAIRLANRTGERLAVLVTVDGLNVITGARQAVDQRGRMYVLDPWGHTEIQGWRTSLDDVRRFTFVDEERSYAARSGQANARMGWIEVAVYRERHRYGWRQSPDVTRDEQAGQRPRSQPAPAPGASDEAAEAPQSKARDGRKRDGDMAYGAPRESYPGTGWGEQAHDPVRVVDFQPEPRPAERITLRYEYARALRALGILPWRWTGDRLRERERGDGFAKPPRW